MFKKMLYVMSVTVIGICGVCEGMKPTSSTADSREESSSTTMALYEKKAREVIIRTDINGIAIDSEPMCILEKEIACGSHIPGKIDMDSFEYRKELAKLALQKINFQTGKDAALKGALICFALQSTSYLSGDLWNRYKIEEYLFGNGSDNARTECLRIYGLALKEFTYAFIPTHIWMFMYSKGLVDTRIPTNAQDAS